MTITRRDLFAGASATTLLSFLPTGAQSQAAAPRDTLVVIFQRGGADWLQMLAPSGDANYQRARPTIRVPVNANQGIGTLDGVDFYISASAPELKTLYDSGKLAFVHATGLLTNDRSHFTCQDNMERGVADGEPRSTTGWLGRHMSTLGADLPILASLSSSQTVPLAFAGDQRAIAVGNSQAFTVSGGEANTNLIRNMSAGDTALERKSRETLNAVASIQTGLRTVDTSQSNSAGYTGGALSNALRSIAQVIRMNVGLTSATVEFGGWDTHNNLVNEFGARTQEFSRSIAAFWRDMAAYQDRLTVVTMTEFGRRFTENANQGTDHGAASGMLVLGGNVNGKKIYGSWPGLAANQLRGGDLAVSTDYRQVLAEIIKVRHDQNNLAAVFPTLAYRPLGLVKANGTT